MTTAFEKMDKMYRHQRYFYDFTRKYYLLGRDRLISKLDIKDGNNNLEVGCGTGRNLIILARKYPNANFYGIDASAAMLKTAADKIDAARLANIFLRAALADEYSFDHTFGLKRPIDAIYFSYSISMIPAWQGSIENALGNLKSGGSLFIVDFYDQKELPGWFRRILKGWLKQFHVDYPAKLLPFLAECEQEGQGRLTVDSLYKSYSFLARFEKF